MNPAFSGWRSYALVEPPLLLFFIADSATSLIIYDLVVYRSCQTILKTDNKDCERLHTNDTNEELQHKIQPHASSILMYKTLLGVLMPAFLAIFLGPWSDRYGRKPLLLSAYFGYAACFLLWSVLSSLDNLNPWIFLIASVPPASVGGYYSLSLASYCYIADTIQENDRAWHLTWLQSVIPIGQLLGNLAGPLIFHRFGYATVFGISSVVITIAAFYILFFVPESVIRDNGKRSWRNLFDLSVIKDMFVICTRKREGFDRIIIWCCVCALAVCTFVGNSELSIAFLFAEARLGWGVDEYSIYSSAVIVLTIVGTLLGGKILKTFIDRTMANMLIAVLTNVSAFAGSMAKALTTESWHFFLSPVLGMLGELSGPVIRNALLKSVPPQEVGRVFSLTVSTGALMTLAFAPFHTMVYARYMPPNYPCPAFLVSAGFYALNIVIVKIIDWRFSKLCELKNPSVTVIQEKVFHDPSITLENGRG